MRLPTWDQLLENFQLRLSKVDALPQLALLGVVSGIATGVVIILFRQAIELPQSLLLPNGNPENYEGLSWQWRVALPTFGGAVIGLILHKLEANTRQVGVVHVLERLHFHQAHLPLKNAVVQFGAGVVSILCGHSVGREGPGIHLGAAISSLGGQWLLLPNNSIRILVACGTAASISASFNTPIAGVVFAMEVVMIEYTATMIIPIILAAFVGAVMTRAVYGNEPAFSVPGVDFGSLTETPFVLLLGIGIGLLAVVFIQLVTVIAQRTESSPVWLRLTAAGVFVGLCALMAPEIMGIGYDTINNAMVGQLTVVSLASILIFKLLATSVCVGTGLPGGLIGPALFIGAMSGGLVELALPNSESSTALYVLLGMCGMMSAALQAPLAALLCILELSANPNVIFPGMLVIVVSNLVAAELFGKNSIFNELSKARGMLHQTNPITQSLLRSGVASVMERNFVTHDVEISTDNVALLLEGNPRWIVIYKDLKPTSLLPAADLARHLMEHTKKSSTESINLMEIAGKRLDIRPVNLQATLYEAYQAFQVSDGQALFVERPTAPGINKVCGIITKEAIESSYALNK